MATYKVTVEFDFYVDAENEDDALDYCRDAAGDLYLPECADVEEVKTAPKYDLDGLVYGQDHMTVRESLARSNG
jgi:hypothetical protein